MHHDSERGERGMQRPLATSLGTKREAWFFFINDFNDIKQNKLF